MLSDLYMAFAALRWAPVGIDEQVESEQGCASQVLPPGFLEQLSLENLVSTE